MTRRLLLTIALALVATSCGDDTDMATEEYPDAIVRELDRLADEPRPVANSALPPRHLDSERFPDALVDRERIVFGKPLWLNQAIQFPLAELQTECEMTRQLVYKIAWQLDQGHHMDVTDKVSMCNYRANRLVCEAADRAIQVHGGIGYTRHKPFEHIYRHHRRYRITEGSEQIQIRRVAALLFGREAKR